MSLALHLHLRLCLCLLLLLLLPTLSAVAPAHFTRPIHTRRPVSLVHVHLHVHDNDNGDSTALPRRSIALTPHACHLPLTALRSLCLLSVLFSTPLALSFSSSSPPVCVVLPDNNKTSLARTIPVDKGRQRQHASLASTNRPPCPPLSATTTLPPTPTMLASST